MSQIDDLLTDFRSHIPPADPTVAARAAREAQTGQHERDGRVPRRRLAVVASTLSTAAVAGVLAVLLVQSPSQPASGPGAVPTTPRVDWGVVVQVDVTPTPGVGLDTATAGTVQALVERGQERDIAGLDVRATAPGALSVRIPGTQATDEIRRLLTFADLALYDVGTTFLERGPNLNALREAVTRAAPADAKIQGYAVSSRPFPGTIMEILPTRAAAEKLAAGFGPDADILAVPEGIRLVSSGPLDFPGETTIVRDLPMFTAADFGATSVEGDLVTLTLSDEAREWLRNALGGPTRLVQQLAVVRQFQGGGTQIGAVDLASLTRAIDTGTVTFRAPEAYAALLDSDLPSRPIGGRLSQRSLEQYGVRPLPVGEALPLPRPVAKEANRVLPDSIVRAAVTESPVGRVELWVGRTPKGEDWFWTVPERQRLGLEGSGNWCEPSAGPPRLQSCGSGGSDIAVLFTGRVDASVARVEIVPIDGSPAFAATVQNGAYIAVRAALDRETREPGQPPWAPIVGPYEVVAFDSSGTEVARIDRNGYIVLPGVRP